MPPPRDAPPAQRAPVAARVRRAPRRWRVSRWSLRTRLLATLLALLAVICVIISVITSLALRHFLVSQLDEKLLSAHHRAAVGYLPPDNRLPNGVPDSLGAAQAPGTLGALVANGQVVSAAVSSSGGQLEPITTSEAQVILALPVGQPQTRRLGSLGDYRLIAAPDTSGAVIVTGLPLSGVEDTLSQLTVIELIVAGAGLLLVGIAGAMIMDKTLRPLRRVAATATKVAEMPLDRGEVALSIRVPAADTDPGTEVGQVGAALNRMLGHVGRALAARQASEMRVRQFVADAGHELRTPLAAIRGYAELTRRVRDDVPADVAHAMHRVESEAARMTTLVEDLLLLARLDSGRPLVREPVELSQLIVDATSDAHIAGPQHQWRLELPEEPVTVIGDPVRLHQVLANLLANARTHTPPGTTVTVRLGSETNVATIQVADDGPGIPADLLPRVFERFVRGDTSRSRLAGSTGLGLPIVAAVVHAHHGSVEVRSGPGRTVFTVRLAVVDPVPEAPKAITAV